MSALYRVAEHRTTNTVARSEVGEVVQYNYREVLPVDSLRWE